MKNLVVIGSTGSIGRQTLDVARRFPDRLRVVGLAARRDAGLLTQQVAEFRPLMAHLAEGGHAVGEARRVGLEEMVAHRQADVVVMATTGRVGLLPTLAAVGAGKQVVLANKEVLVMAGELLVSAATRSGARLVPVDSEHSAIWQCLVGEVPEGEVAVAGGPRSVRRVILTASGGALRDRPRAEMDRVTVAEALAHPTWEMGPKVTVDSATLMNKGFEVMETHWLFGIPYDRIEIVLHRESIVHSLVEFADGSVKAQLGPPDMRLPIQYALSFPERWENPDLPRLDLARVPALTFSQPDLERYPCLRLALEAARLGNTYPAVLSAADELAVELFLAGRIGFAEIPRLVESALATHHPTEHPDLATILETVETIRHEALVRSGR